MRSVLCLCLPLLLCGFAAADDGSDTPGVAMATAAARLAELLPAEQRDKLHYGFADPERLNWHFIPKDRNGIVLWDLFGEPRKAAEELVKSGLSAAGYAKTLQVRSLEEVLYLLKVVKKPTAAIVDTRISTISPSSELPLPPVPGAGVLKATTCP